MITFSVGWIGPRNLARLPLKYHRFLTLTALIAIGAIFSACATETIPDRMEEPPSLASVPAPEPAPKPAVSRIVRASWYGPGFIGRPTSSGERFNPNKLTAASTTIPMGSIVRVMNIDNGRTVDVRINDCGPFVPGRSLDLSHRAAKELRMERRGVASVKLLSIHSPPDAAPPCNN
jgi:rare lipoprotein A